MPQTADTALPAVPPEVLQFAEEKGAAPYLPAVLSMTRRIFPQGEVVVVMGEDYEDPTYRYVLFEVDVTGWTSEEMLEAMTRWSGEIVEHCPTTHTPYFTYSTREKA